MKNTVVAIIKSTITYVCHQYVSTCYVSLLLWVQLFLLRVLISHYSVCELSSICVDYNVNKLWEDLRKKWNEMQIVFSIHIIITDSKYEWLNKCHSYWMCEEMHSKSNHSFIESVFEQNLRNHFHSNLILCKH